MEPILYIGISQSFFAAFILIMKKNNKAADRLLAYLLIVSGLGMGIALFNELYENVDTSMRIFGVLYLTISPFTYLYTKSFVVKNFRYKHEHHLYFIPFYVYSLILLSFYEYETASVSEMVNRIAFKYLIIPVFFIQYFFTAIKTKRIMDILKKKALDEFSFYSDKITLGWVGFTNIVFSLIFFTSILLTILSKDFGIYFFDVKYLLFIGFTFFAFAVSFLGFRQPQIFGKRKDERVVKESIKMQEGEVEKETKYERSGLQEEVALNYISKIQSYLKNEKVYLKGDLMLQDLSDALNIQKHHITQALNEYMHKNFYTLINEFRVMEAIEKMKDPKYDHYSLLAIGFDSGFNTKSSFYNSFKKYTGYAPAEYKKTQL